MTPDKYLEIKAIRALIGLIGWTMKTNTSSEVD